MKNFESFDKFIQKEQLPFKIGDFVLHKKLNKVGSVISIREDDILGERKVLIKVEFDDGTVGEFFSEFLTKISEEEALERIKKAKEESLRQFRLKLEKLIDISELNNLDETRREIFNEIAIFYIETLESHPEILKLFLEKILDYIKNEDPNEVKKLSLSFVEKIEKISDGQSADYLTEIIEKINYEFWKKLDFPLIVVFITEIYPQYESFIYEFRGEEEYINFARDEPVSEFTKKSWLIIIELMEEKRIDDCRKFLDLLFEITSPFYKFGADDLIPLLKAIEKKLDLISILTSSKEPYVIENIFLLLNLGQKIHEFDNELIKTLLQLLGFEVFKDYLDYLARAKKRKFTSNLIEFIKQLQSQAAIEPFISLIDHLNKLTQDELGYSPYYFYFLDDMIKKMLAVDIITAYELLKKITSIAQKEYKRKRGVINLSTLNMLLELSTLEELDMAEYLFSQNLLPFPEWVRYCLNLNKQELEEWIKKQQERINRFFEGIVPDLENENDVNLFYAFLLNYCIRTKLTFTFFEEILGWFKKRATPKNIKVLLTHLLGKIPEDFEGLSHLERAYKAFEIKGGFEDFPPIVGNRINYDYKNINIELILQRIQELSQNLNKFLDFSFLEEIKDILGEQFEEYKLNLFTYLMSYITIRDENLRKEFSVKENIEEERLSKLDITKARNLKLIAEKIETPPSIVEFLQKYENKQLIIEGLIAVLLIELQKSQIIKPHILEWLKRLFECYGLTDPGLISRLESEEMYSKIDGLLYSYQQGWSLIEYFKGKNVPIPQEILRLFEKRSHEIEGEIGKVLFTEREEEVVSIINNRFLALFRGYIASDCTAEMRYEILRVFEPKEHFYIIFVGKYARGYINLFEAEDSKGDKYLVIDTIQIENISTQVLSEIISYLKTLAYQKNFKGLAVPTKENLRRTFNYTIPRNFILNLEEFNKGELIYLTFKHSTRYFSQSLHPPLSFEKPFTPYILLK
ncbi:MAG: hypothetical protein QXW69_07110 [Nitrososphaerota archaeon]